MWKKIKLQLRNVFFCFFFLFFFFCGWFVFPKPLTKPHLENKVFTEGNSDYLSFLSAWVLCHQGNFWELVLLSRFLSMGLNLRKGVSSSKFVFFSFFLFGRGNEAQVRLFCRHELYTGLTRESTEIEFLAPAKQFKSFDLVFRVLLTKTAWLCCTYSAENVVNSQAQKSLVFFLKRRAYCWKISQCEHVNRTNESKVDSFLFMCRRTLPPWGCPGMRCPFVAFVAKRRVIPDFDLNSRGQWWLPL